MSHHKQRRDHWDRAFANHYLAGDSKHQEDMHSESSTFAPIVFTQSSHGSLARTQVSNMWPRAPQTYRASSTCNTLHKKERVAQASVTSAINHRTAIESRMKTKRKPHDPERRLPSPLELRTQNLVPTTPKTTKRETQQFPFTHSPSMGGSLSARAAAHLRAQGTVHTITGGEEKMLLFADHAPKEINAVHSRRYEDHTHSTAIRQKPQVERRHNENLSLSVSNRQPVEASPSASVRVDKSNNLNGTTLSSQTGRTPPALPPNAQKLLAGLKCSLDVTNRGLNTSPEMNDIPPPPTKPFTSSYSSEGYSSPVGVLPSAVGIEGRESSQGSTVYEPNEGARPGRSAGVLRKQTTEAGFTLDPETYKRKTPGEFLMERYRDAPFMPSDPESHMSFQQRKKFHKNSAPGYLSGGKQLPASHQLKLTEKLVGDFRGRHESLNALVKKYKYRDMSDPEYDAFDDERNQLYAEIDYTSNEGAIPAKAFESNAEYILKLVDPSVGEAPDVKTIKRVMSRKASRVAGRHDME